MKSAQILYKSSNGYGSKFAMLDLNTQGKYEATINIGPYDAEGEWKVDFINLVDNAENTINIYPNDTGYEFLSNATFKVKAAVSDPLQSLSQKCVTQNENWTIKTINGDLYIGPKAVLTINGSVTVNGNIHVLGAIKNYGNLNVTGTIYASQFNWGNSTLYNGTVLMLGGTNSIGSIVASNNPIDIPFKVYDSDEKNNLTAKDGTLNITGATLPIGDLYVDGTKINYNVNGTFSLSLNVANKTSITFQLIDVFGNKKDIKYNVINSNKTIPVTGVGLNKTQVSMNVDETATLITTVTPEKSSNKNVTWTSSNPKIATVGSTGKVTAVSAGTSTITATTEDGNKTASCSITVNNSVIKVASVNLNKTTDTLIVGATDTLLATVNPTNAANKNVTWTSSNPKIATVGSTGKVTAVSAGTSTITATTEDGNKTASCNISVSNKLPYDTNNDNVVDSKDLENVKNYYNTRGEDNNWQEAYDFNNDGTIDVYDLVMLSKKMN